MPTRRDMSPSLEDYLEAVLDLSADGDSEGVRTTDIAARLGVSKASVNQAMTLLAGRSLIQQERYGPVLLTEPGRRCAKAVRNRHSTIRHFLISVLGVSEHIAEADACKIEHVLSEETMHALVEFMEGRRNSDDD